MCPLEPDHRLRPLSRRRFLAAGPALLLAAGCRRAVTPAPQGDSDGFIVRKATRFRGKPDGRERELNGYDGQFPGPEIRVKEGDTVRVKLVNDLGVPTSIHWHGMHQPGTWKMDGVDGVSAPPIEPGKEFVYEFKATPAGTHWYHSHTGVQYGDGLFGPLIVEERTPIAKYDRDAVLMISDWFLQPGEELLAKVLKGGMDMKPGMKMPKADHEKMPGMKPMAAMDLGDVPFQSALINGKGRAKGVDVAPMATVEVKKGERLRLRLINAASTYAFRFQIDGHPMTVIASDGPALKPVTVDNLVLNIGERYDVLLDADKDGVHLIRAATLDGNEVVGMLRYAGAGDGTPVNTKVKWGARALTPEQLRAPAAVELDPKPREIPLLLGGSMMPYRWSINGQYYPKADQIELNEGEAVRFILKNPTGMDHPFHLHGHSFRVLGKPGALNLTDPPLKDTINVPAKGDVVIQWVADNPGKWFFHCHIEWHLAAGMARVIEIKPRR
jgi:FtsP/CotA-like multicopper oxidase with cupredoxin domain